MTFKRKRPLTSGEKYVFTKSQAVSRLSRRLNLKKANITDDILNKHTEKVGELYALEGGLY